MSPFSAPGWRLGPFGLLAADYQEGVLIAVYHDTVSIRADVASPAVTGFDLLRRRAVQWGNAEQMESSNVLFDVSQVAKGSKWTATIKGKIADDTLHVELLGPEIRTGARLQRTDSGLFCWILESKTAPTSAPARSSS